MWEHTHYSEQGHHLEQQGVHQLFDLLSVDRNYLMYQVQHLT